MTNFKLIIYEYIYIYIHFYMGYKFLDQLFWFKIIVYYQVQMREF
jgi:hypothetical protein